MNELATFKPTWLCRTEADRARLLDMDQRLDRVRLRAFGVLALTLLAMGPWLGWWPLIPLAVAGVVFRVAGRRAARAERPEYHVAGAWLVSQIVIALCVALTGGPGSPAVFWFAIPAITLPTRFNVTGVKAGVAASVVLLLASTLGVDSAGVIDDPTRVLSPLALLCATVLLTMALSQSEVQHRGEAIIDGLTGLLNRKAMAGRAEELVAQSRVTGRPVGLVLADIDHFKRVNDLYGHATGDAVLRDVAYRFRTELRAYDLAYRLGGEEFAVLVPGATLTEAEQVAERLREAVAAEPSAGVDVTISLGVAVSEIGELDFKGLFDEADAALYAAKDAGRDRVVYAASNSVTS